MGSSPDRGFESQRKKYPRGGGVNKRVGVPRKEKMDGKEGRGSILFLKVKNPIRGMTWTDNLEKTRERKNILKWVRGGQTQKNITSVN